LPPDVPIMQEQCLAMLFDPWENFLVIAGAPVNYHGNSRGIIRWRRRVEEHKSGGEHETDFEEAHGCSVHRPCSAVFEKRTASGRLDTGIWLCYFEEAEPKRE